MADLNILALAVREKRMVVTMDKDFGELVYRSREPHAGVLLLRLEEARSAEKSGCHRRDIHKVRGSTPRQLLGVSERAPAHPHTIGA